MNNLQTLWEIYEQNGKKFPFSVIVHAKELNSGQIDEKIELEFIDLEEGRLFISKKGESQAGNNPYTSSYFGWAHVHAFENKKLIDFKNDISNLLDSDSISQSENETK